MKKYFFLLVLNITFLNVFSQDFVRSKFEKTEGHNSEQYHSMTFNGSWCWFSDPRAVYYEGDHKRSYTGWVDNYGDIHIAFFEGYSMQQCK